MLDLKDKNAPTGEKLHGARALTPTQWQTFLAERPGEFVIIGDRPDTEDSEYVSAPWPRSEAQRIFDEVVEACDFAAKAGYRLRIVAVQR